MDQLEVLQLAPDELESLRLVDLLGMQQQQAAVEMQVSRQTLANILKKARAKVASCLVEGKALEMLGSQGEDSSS